MLYWIKITDSAENGMEQETKTIEKDLRKVAKSVRVIVPTPDIEHGDISDFFKDCGKFVIGVGISVISGMKMRKINTRKNCFKFF